MWLAIFPTMFSVRFTGKFLRSFSETSQTSQIVQISTISEMNFFVYPVAVSSVNKMVTWVFVVKQGAR